MKYRLICIDIDGTLLDDDKKLLPEVKEAVRAAAGMGVKIALASGRVAAGIDLVEEKLGIECIKICSAGTYVLYKNQCIDEDYIHPDTMKKIYEQIAKKNNVNLWIFKGREWYVSGMDERAKRETKIVRCEPKLADIEKHTKQWKEEKSFPNKLLVAAEAEKIRKIYRHMKDEPLPDIDFACSSENFIEIFPKGVTKGTALKKLCKKMNIDIGGTIAIGDQELDIPMIEAAGIGVAMGNAIDELKEKADFITKSNNEAGVAYAIEHYLNERRKGE